jgi:hypothetical protein
MNTTQIRRAVIHFSALLILLFVGSASAQEFRGTITGTVADPNGSVVPGVTVTIRNTGTNITSSVTTNAAGAYSFPLLLPGNYTLTATTNGFKTSTIENITVRVDDNLTVDIGLQVGASAEVNIVANTEVVEKGTVTLGTLVSQRQIEELPLAEGAPYTLATQAPGIVYTGDPNFQGPTANGNLAGFRSNGAAGNQINLDGSPNLAYDGQVAFTPPSEATREFKVQTNAFDAQNGFTAGSTVNVALKSGTNDFHGAAYYFDRDRSRTANNFFNNRSGAERPERKYYRYGVTLNGPVIKDRTFFLFAYERQKDNVAQPVTYSVPTMLMRQGNFSELSYPIYDPLTGVAGGNGCTGTNVCRLPFLNNIIPAERIYAASRAYLALFPEPNLPGLTDNYRTDRNLIRPYRSYTAKIDHNINATNKISGNWYHSRNTEDRYNVTMEEGSIFQGFENRRNMGANVNFTSTLSNSFILDVRGSLARFKLRRFQDGQPTARDLGFTGLPSDRQDHIFPRMNFQNYATLGSERADWNEGRERPFTVFTLQPTVTQIWGNHTLKYGVDFRRLNERFFTAGYGAGQFTFNGAFTMQASNSGATEQNRAGRDIAAFLLGIPAAGSSIDNPTEYEVTSEYTGFFIHDDFRVTQNLTLNLGLRYDVETGYSEKGGRMIVDFDRTAPSPIAAQALANYNASPPAGVPIDAFQNLRGGFIFADDQRARNQSADLNNCQPRIGMSWAITPKTVLRAGFGIFTAPFQLVTQNVVFQPGYSSPTVITQSTGLPTGITYLSNPFPNGVAPSPGDAQGLMTFTGRNVTGTNANGPTTYIPSHERANANYSRFIVGVQQELFYRIGVEATYIYSRGSDLAVIRDINPVPRQYLNDLRGVTDPTAVTTAINNVNTFLNFNLPTGTNPLRGLIPDGGDWNQPRILRERLLVPFPQFGYLAVGENNGSSEYQSLQFQVVKRFTRGLSLNGSYTFSREHEKTRYLNPQDDELTEMVALTERPHRFTFSGIYELPFGRSRTWGSEWHPVVDGILGGWQIQAVYEWQSGEPLSFGNVFYNGDPSQLENLLGKKDSEGRRYGVDIPAWDVSGFFLNGIQSTANNNLPAFGNNFQANSTNTLRYFPITMGQFRNQRFLKFDVGISKNFRISEGMKLQVRVEAINALNTPYFNAPNLDPGNAAFGRTNGQRQPPRDIQIGGRFTF